MAIQIWESSYTGWLLAYPDISVISWIEISYFTWDGQTQQILTREEMTEGYFLGVSNWSGDSEV